VVTAQLGLSLVKAGDGVDGEVGVQVDSDISNERGGQVYGEIDSEVNNIWW